MWIRISVGFVRCERDHAWCQSRTCWGSVAYVGVLQGLHCLGSLAMMLCHSAGPVRHFMELVVTGLSKNPFYTAKEKQEYVKWYRKYFSQFTPEELQAIPVTRMEPDTQQKWQKRSMLAVNLLLVVCTVISFVPMQATLQLFVACRTLSNEKLDWGSWEQRCGVVSSFVHFVFINPVIPSGACCRRKTVMCSTSFGILWHKEYQHMHHSSVWCGQS